MKKYKMFFNNGNEPLTLYAKSVEHHDGNFYIEGLYYFTIKDTFIKDYTIKDTFIKEVKEIEKLW